MIKRPTRRQMITASAYAFGPDRVRPTQAELAARFGVKKAAIARRIAAFRACLSPDELERFDRLTRRGRRGRVVALQLNGVHAV